MLLPLGFASQRLEDKLDNISVAGGQSKPEVPEAILSCVQCKSEYKESENGEGSCKYHTSKLTGFHRYTYSCCNANSPNYESALSLTGCTKGRHRSEHHDEYTYSAYLSYMSKVVSSFCTHCSLRACWIYVIWIPVSSCLRTVSVSAGLICSLSPTMQRSCGSCWRHWTRSLSATSGQR